MDLAQSTRDEAEDKESDKKERVLHTRIPAVLDQELKRFAQNLRIPVSNLVRTILEDALEVADAAGDRVEERLRQAASQLHSERERLRRKIRPDPLSDVYAYQRVTLAQEARCAKCDIELAAGIEVHLGLLEPDADGHHGRIFVCEACAPHPTDVRTETKKKEPS